MRQAIRLTPLVLLVLLPASGLAGAAVLTVSKTADTLDGACDADCSLREAVVAANASPGPDTINLGPSTYRLTRLGPFEEESASGDLDVLGEVAILGAGADRTVLDGGLIDRILEVQPDGKLELRGVTVRNGWARISSFQDGQGGGIRATGRLELVDCLIADNRAESGGGVFGLDLKIRGTTFTGNSAMDGGGLFSGFRLDMENVTLSGNVGRYGGGAMLVDSEAGLRVSHVTVSGNEATSTGGGIYLDPIACPAGAPCPTGPFLRLDRSIVAGNKAPQNRECYLLGHEGFYNVFGSDDGCMPGVGDRANTEPRLSPLGSYGGPTPTQPPLPGSPAVDIAPGTTCARTDQQGHLRPADGNGDGFVGCDAGAVEINSDCAADGNQLCLGPGNRFHATAWWTTRDGTGEAQAVPLTLDTGAFWFFNANNLELMIKVLDGCAVNGHYWVFVSGLTDVGVEITVRDTVTGKTWNHIHAGGIALPPRLDTGALDICPGGA
ncbi:MAG: choice-of-anchor Q domain-containing protein [Acidobacteriota bacterium]